jgi:hypothetical protein
MRTPIVVFLVAGLLAIVPFQVGAANLPTYGLSRSTAYTLNRGDWQIGSTFSFLAFGIPGITVEYGLTDYLQLGTSLTRDIEGDLNIRGKFWLLQVGTVDLAFPFAMWFQSDTGFSSHVAAIMSWQAIDPLSLHMGTWISVFPHFYYWPYLIMNLHPLPDLALIGEVGLRPFQVTLGIRIDLWDFLSLRVAGGFNPVSFWGGLSIRL